MTYNSMQWLAHFLDTAETQALKRALNNEISKRGLVKLAGHCEQGLLLATVISLMAYQGLRVSEAIGVEKDNITTTKAASGRLAVVKLKIIGKGKKIRVVRLGDVERYLFSEYMNSSLYQAHETRVFSISADVPIYYNFLDRRLKVLFGKNFGAHDFRRGFTFQSSASGRAFSAISHQLGHTDMDTTRIYDKRSIHRLERDFKNPHPELIDCYPLVGNLKSGDFLECDKLDSAFKGIKKLRDKVVFALVAWGGVKTSEVVGLKRIDFKKTDRRLQVGSRLIPLHDHVYELLVEWCDKKDLTYKQPMFPTSTRNALKHLFQRISKTLSFRINGRLLRASFIVAELNRGVDPISLANICGCTYSNIARYIPCACDARAAALERRVMM